MSFHDQGSQSQCEGYFIHNQELQLQPCEMPGGKH